MPGKLAKSKKRQKCLYLHSPMAACCSACCLLGPILLSFKLQVPLLVYDPSHHRHRAIDHAIERNEPVRQASKLPFLLKHLCNFEIPELQAATLVLIYSVKFACKYQWFSNEDACRINFLAAEVEKIFTTSANSVSASTCLSIPRILSNYYARIQLSRILGFVTVKPGFGSYLVHFDVTNNQNSSRGHKICLFVVAKTINEEPTLVTLPNVHVFLNGTAVVGGHMVPMDDGPLTLTDVTHVIQFGPNLLQVLGESNGTYEIVIGSATMIMNPPQQYPTIRPLSGSMDAPRGFLPYMRTLSPSRRPFHQGNNL